MCSPYFLIDKEEPLLSVLVFYYKISSQNKKTLSERKQAEMEDDPPRTARKWIEGLSKGVIGHGLETLNLKGLQAIHVQKGLIRCDLVVPESVSVNFYFSCLQFHSNIRL